MVVDRLPGPSGLQIQSANDLVYEALRSQIMEALEPGAPLQLIEVANRLAVSITPVRSALERLIAEGLVVRERHRGASVAPLSLPDFLDIYAVRTALEGMAARLGAPAMTEEDCAAMCTCMEELRAIPEAGGHDLNTYLRLQWDMHEVCYAASGHVRLLREIRLYRRQAERYLRLALGREALIVEDFIYQKSYLEACLTHDGAKAERMLRLLMKWTVDRVGELLGDFGESSQG
ncbi:MAG TPA: GntR family transcriptional regulator [Candidatus Micrarchaeaceae archaeon]|nr:GntR family transcriptional regulator [Candidatus Micrarchaeaceae archaeon]